MIQLERALTHYIADKLNLEVDKEIFRGGLPVGTDSCSVMLLESRTTNELGCQRFMVKFYCSYPERDLIMSTVNSLVCNFPAYGIALAMGSSNLKLKSITKGMSGLGKDFADDGQLKSFGEIFLTVLV
ncbi:MAG: hypothetical protein GY750_07115 [Lentisphaerae bacterium]|nr:hypothetical protein [Lentisphaerota bacterium]MCP4101181.1 hypothetical protein [Lentisphaerota bacterium]